MGKSTISCELHDYIEIACLHGYQLKLKLRDGQTLTGRAVDTLVTSEKREFLLIDDGQKRQVELNQIEKMVTLSPYAAFKEVIF